MARTYCFYQYLPEVLPSLPRKPVPFGPNPSCAIATEVSGVGEFMSRKLRRHSHLRGLDPQVTQRIELRPVSYRAPFGKSRNGFPYCDLSIWGGIHQSKMPSPCPRELRDV